MIGVDRIIGALPIFYVAWGLPFLFALVLLVPPWQHPDEHAHFLRIAHIVDGGLLGHRFGSSAGGRTDPAIAGAMAPFTSIHFHAENKVTAPMLASADQARWSGTTQETAFPNTAIYPPFLYTPGVLGIWLGRALDLTIIKTLYVARAANAIASVLVTFAALTLARRTRSALAAVAILPMTLALEASVSQDALMISLVLLAVGAIDRVIDEGRVASGWETLLITCALLFPAMARPPYVVLSGLLLLTAPGKSLRAWVAIAAIIACTGVWWTFAVADIVVPTPPGDALAQWRFMLTNPTRAMAAAWMTVLSHSVGLGEGLIGVLGWLDTHLPRFFLLLAASTLVITPLSATAGPVRRPWLPMVIILFAATAIYVTNYVLYAAPGASVVVTLQGRYFLPLAAVLPLAAPQLPFGTKILPLSVASLVMLAMIEPAVVIRTIAMRYYLSLG